MRLQNWKGPLHGSCNVEGATGNYSQWPCRMIGPDLTKPPSRNLQATSRMNDAAQGRKPDSKRTKGPRKMTWRSDEHQGGCCWCSECCIKMCKINKKSPRKGQKLKKDGYATKVWSPNRLPSIVHWKRTGGRCCPSIIGQVSEVSGAC